LIASAVAILGAFLNLGLQNGAAWTVVAASSAVIAAAVSAWTSAKIIEHQEDAQRPFPYPYVDVSSRYQVLLLRVQNFGGTTAHSIRLEWNEPLRNHQGSNVGSQEIRALVPQQSVAELIDVEHAFFEREQDANYSGTVFFKDRYGRDDNHPFFVGIEQYRIAASHDDEVLKTNYRLQQIPEQFKGLNRELKALRRDLRER